MRSAANDHPDGFQANNALTIKMGRSIQANQKTGIASDSGVCRL